VLAVDHHGDRRLLLECDLMPDQFHQFGGAGLLDRALTRCAQLVEGGQRVDDDLNWVQAGEVGGDSFDFLDGLVTGGPGEAAELLAHDVGQAAGLQPGCDISRAEEEFW
jgi:hypothetical protein